MAFDLLIPPRRGEAIVDPDGFATRRMIEYLEQNSEIINQRRTIDLDIGDWNMLSTASLTVAHGLTLANIRSITAMIRNDAGTASYPVTPENAVAAGNSLYISFIDGTNVQLVRLAGGPFDHADFSSTSYNRGWITITYIN